MTVKMFQSSEQTSNVIAMDRFRTDKRAHALRQIEAYWTVLRSDGDLPYRSQIDPRGLENVLEHTFILERIAPGIARFRIAGSHLVRLSGMEVRGMPMTCLFAAGARTTFSCALETCFDSPAIMMLDIEAETGIGRPNLEGEIVLLPLKSDLGETNRVLGGMITRGPIGRTARRFNITHVTDRLVYGTAKEASAPAVQSFAEDAAPFDPCPSHLRLIKTDS
ncbi:PAS domain-containing protein [Thalassococcus sp. S3]|uniref:PAS domain-containing protein n=1 Tax=Thalassococcus sp. S3 TaxID=2017482 RepID=UPI0010248292|nr:PAS domain-containing protein [Thalassococcus sp. S3]QBF31881.1 diguanylate cyclase [Thalassococcus sp. S3]